MAETYSLARTATHARSPFATTNLTLPDSAAQNGHLSKLMQTGSQVYCKRPDGSFGWFTIDTERSRPGGPIVLLHTGR
jgi:hypothetical protein